jgi:3-oxoacyl-[acyl-carrier-protein] synthase-3
MYSSVILGAGAYIPPVVFSNQDFSNHQFFSEQRVPIDTPTEVVVQKFQQITGIQERRYANDDLNASDLGTIAAAGAIADSGIDPETIDQIIVAHNFGNVYKHTIQSDAVPSLAALIKQQLGIANPACVAYDILFGCPGWVQGMIQAHAFFKAGMARRALIIGTETLSRVIDQHDRDSMIFSDGAGAVVLDYQPGSPDGPGILGFAVRTDSVAEASFINMGPSYMPDADPAVRYIKMQGRKVYEYAMTMVPAAMKQCMDNSGVPIEALKKVFIHQANEKMDEGIIKRFYQLYGRPCPPDIMPMSIHWLGNSSVATVPTLYHLVKAGLVPGHELHPGDVVMFASVGAGMNVNAVCYRC